MGARRNPPAPLCLQVGTTSKFDETLVLLSDLTGLPLLVYKYNRPHGKGGFRGSTAEVCPDMEYCRQVVRQSAPLDHRMWDKWGPRFDARIGSLGAEFEARVAAFKADVKAAQAAWGSAPRAQTICRCCLLSVLFPASAGGGGGVCVRAFNIPGAGADQPAEATSPPPAFGHRLNPPTPCARAGTIPRRVLARRSSPLPTCAAPWTTASSCAARTTPTACSSARGSTSLTRP